MKFYNIEESEDGVQNELTRNLTKLQLEKTFGSGNIKLNEETEFYEIRSKLHLEFQKIEPLIGNSLLLNRNKSSFWKKYY
ncbi:hypothetical protein BTO06_16905 [Tenacibaculum sp. SZ-18]|uniref:hypothetical protein n=1 Tax=Tenacibaculum sp. SZ-18 TaxID=754423 RepID=UPI000C2D4CC5|nr:hypothetical protein [Tenacibaculum sp. SZ-18]AUC16721.1 hypothetical protein BTO06_16905 [Tenacibaculum sp. SZ-18]